MDIEKAQKIMTETIKRLESEAGMEYAQALAIRQPDGGHSMVVVFGSKATVEKTILQLDPLPIR